jgi:hypothetical protein
MADRPVFPAMRRMLAAAVMFGQPFGLAGSSSTTAPVSPSVMATSMCVTNLDGQGALELLVLWRGSPAWYWRDRGKGGGGSSMSGGMRGPDAAEVRTEWITQGGVNLHLRFEPASRRLWILDQEVPLNDANVVLVDGVDDAGGPRVVGSVRIEPAFDSATDLPPGMPTGPPGTRAQGVPPQTFIRRSPELVEFLRCDVKAPNLSGYEQQALDTWCAWATQP